MSIFVSWLCYINLFTFMACCIAFIMLMACILSGGVFFFVCVCVCVIASVAFHVNDTYSSSVRIEVLTEVLLMIRYAVLTGK